MHLEEFAHGHSFFHRRDPRVKVLVFIPLVFVTALSPNLKSALVALAAGVVCIILCRISIPAIVRRGAVINAFLLLLWCTVPFSVPGKGLAAIGPFCATSEGIVSMVLITIKANALFLFTIAFLGTSEINVLAHACAHLQMPKKLVVLFFFFYRYISVLHEEYTKITNAARARAFYPQTNTHTWRTYGHMIGMLFVKSYERSHRVYQALQLRGFTGEFPLLYHFRFQPADGTCAVLAVLYIGGMIFLWK